MKTKLQILKESIVYVFILGFISMVLFQIMTSIFGEETWAPLVISSLVSFVLTCLLMGYLFEKEKPLWIASLKYIIIGIFSAIFTIILIAIGFQFIVDILLDQAGNFFKNQMGNQGIKGIFLFIPFIILSFFFVILGVFAYILVLYFLGNLLFSFLLQWGINKYNITSISYPSTNTVTEIREKEE